MFYRILLLPLLHLSLVRHFDKFGCCSYSFVVKCHFVRVCACSVLCMPHTVASRARRVQSSYAHCTAGYIHVACSQSKWQLMVALVHTIDSDDI